MYLRSGFLLPTLPHGYTNTTQNIVVVALLAPLQQIMQIFRFFEEGKFCVGKSFL
jgi:hypothetical protein